MAKPGAAQAGLILTYYRLTKPGIVYGNVLSAVAGFLLASAQAGGFKWRLFLALISGVALVIASGCVLNNYIDRGIDSKMKRTRGRATATGIVSARAAMAYAAVLAAAGFTCLVLFTNALTVWCGVAGLFSYVVLYGISKRRGPYGTLVGSISGATPIAAGYAAVGGQLDATMVVLFLAMAFWQMPHFYAIALLRQKDYAVAGLPVLPLVRGTMATKKSILAFTGAFILAAAALTFIGATGYVYLVVMTAFGLAWIWRGFKGFLVENDAKWGGKMFGFSLKVLLVFCVMLSLDAFLP